MSPTTLARAAGAGAATLALLIPLVGATAAPTTVNPDGSATIDVAFFSDFHGHIADGGGVGVSCVVEGLRAANPDTVLLSNGDSVGGSEYTSAVLDDDPTLAWMNAIGVDASNFGNHEFDKGFDDFVSHIDAFTDFPWITSTITGSNSGTDIASVSDPYYLYDVARADGTTATVGFVMGTTPETPSLVAPDATTGLDFGDLTDMSSWYGDLNTQAAALRDGDASNGEADVVIAMVHYGHAELDTTQLSGNISAVFTGHTHQNFLGTGTNAAGATIPVIEADDYGDFVGHLPLTIAADGTATLGTAALIDTEPCADAANPTVDQIIADAVAQAAVAGQARVGDISADFLRPAGGNRANESTIGTFLADVALWQADQIAGADFGIINPGGIRADFLYGTDGVITYQEAFTVQPFGNSMGTARLTGAQVYQLLEQQWQPAGASRPFLRLGISENVTYEFNPAAPAGDRITSVTIDGVPVDEGATYTVSANNFLLTGGDNFTIFSEPAVAATYTDTGMLDTQALINWFEINGTATPTDVQHSIGLTDNAGTLGTLAAGQAMDLSLTSLWFTNGEPRPTDVTVTLGGDELGTFPISDAEVTAYDEFGDAHLQFTIPDLEKYVPAGSVDLVGWLGDPAEGQVAFTETYPLDVRQCVNFTDVPATQPFYAEINWLGCEGVSEGWENGNGSVSYRPLNSITRDAMAAFLYRLAGSPAWTAPTTSPFSDVPTNQPFYHEITWLASQDIAEGWSDGTFRPASFITRDAMAAFMYRLAEWDNGSATLGYTAPATSPFGDVPTSQPFYTEISWLASEGISTGWSDGTFRPLATVTRDAMAAFMFRLNFQVLTD